MAEKKMSATALLEKQLEAEKDPAWDEKIPVFIPRDNAKDTHRVVGVNGKFFQVQKGVWVDVPRPVFEVLRDSMDAEAAAMQRRADLML